MLEKKAEFTIGGYHFVATRISDGLWEVREPDDTLFGVFETLAEAKLTIRDSLEEVHEYYNF